MDPKFNFISSYLSRAFGFFTGRRWRKTPDIALNTKLFVLVLGITTTLPKGMGAAPEPRPSSTQLNSKTVSKSIPDFCAALKKSMDQLGWHELTPCKYTSWTRVGDSFEGDPLMYATLGDPKATNRTLILSMVHGDEITPLYLGFRLIEWLMENPTDLKGAYVMIAPLVNPDGFFAKKRTRMNARGVDVNRNFATKDWSRLALNAWNHKYKADPRRFPGSAPHSEPETLFQEGLIRDFKPQKILSIHAPLNFMDYDGPSSLSLARFNNEYLKECLRLRKKLNAISSGFFPGSLGNYAGVELAIPTLTLELPTADPKKAKAYWEKFRPGIQTMIQYQITESALKASPGNSSVHAQLQRP